MLLRCWIGYVIVGVALLGRAAEVPEDLRFKREPLPAAEDAFIEWKEADEKFVPLLEELKPALTAWSMKGKPTSPEVLAALERWFSSNSVPLQLLEKSLQKSRAQIPPWDPEKDGPFLRAPYELLKARLFMAEQAASKGDHTMATNLLLGNLRLGTMLRDADIPVIQYLVARSARMTTEKGIVRWAMFSGAKEEQIAGVLRAIPPLDDEPEAYERVMKVELTDFIARESDSLVIASNWFEAVRTNELVRSMQAEELQRPMLMIFDPRLVKLHPKPLDNEATLHAFAERFRSLITGAREPWSVSADAERFEASDAVLEAYVKDLKPLLDATRKEEVPLSDKAVKRVAKHYLKLKNPMGRFMLANDNLRRTYVYTFQARTERNATRTLLALRIYEMRHGKLPRTLGELVKEGLLEKVPLDPFAAEALRYSPERKIVWSVGENGVDDGGVSGGHPWQEKDAVYQIRPAKIE